MLKTILILIYGAIAVVAMAWIAEMLHDGLAVGWIWAYLLAINVVAFAFYAYDKIFVDLLNALHVRVPELLLIWGLAVPGGWGGALTAMVLLHHKTGDDSVGFRMELLGAFLLCAVLTLLLIAVDPEPPLVSVEQLDALIEGLVTFVMKAFRGVMGLILNR